MSDMNSYDQTVKQGKWTFRLYRADHRPCWSAYVNSPRLHLSVDTGRQLWLEDYIGGDPYKGDAAEHWKVVSIWKRPQRDKHRVWRCCFGKSHFAWSCKAWFFKFSRYDRRTNIYFRIDRKAHS